MAKNGDNPNVNICLIEKVENLAGQIMEILLKIKPETNEQRKQLEKCMDRLNDWQITKLFNLRRAFE